VHIQHLKIMQFPSEHSNISQYGCDYIRADISGYDAHIHLKISHNNENKFVVEEGTRLYTMGSLDCVFDGDVIVETIAKTTTLETDKRAYMAVTPFSDGFSHVAFHTHVFDEAALTRLASHPIWFIVEHITRLDETGKRGLANKVTGKKCHIRAKQWPSTPQA